MRFSHLAAGVSALALLTACNAADETGTTSEAMPAETAATTETPADAAAPTAQATEADRLNAWFQDAFERNVARSPMTQTFLGMKTNYDQWSDASPEFALEGFEMGQADLAHMRETFDFDALDDSAQLSWRLFEYNAERAAEGQRWVDHGYTFTPRSGPHMNAASFLINNHRVDTVEDAEAYIGRLRNLPTYMDQNIANSRRSAELGVLTPAWTYEPMIATARNIITGAPFDDGEASPLLADFTGKVEGLELDEAETARLIAEAETALTEAVAPAYGRVIALFEEEAEVATEDDGVWKHQDGGESSNLLHHGYQRLGRRAGADHQRAVRGGARM